MEGGSEGHKGQNMTSNDHTVIMVRSYERSAVWEKPRPNSPHDRKARRPKSAAGQTAGQLPDKHPQPKLGISYIVRNISVRTPTNRVHRVRPRGHCQRMEPRHRQSCHHHYRQPIWE